jgi:hypothetical protein
MQVQQIFVQLMLAQKPSTKPSAISFLHCLERFVQVALGKQRLKLTWRRGAIDKKKPRRLRGLKENFKDYFRRRAATNIARPDNPVRAKVVGSGVGVSGTVKI